MKLWKRRRIFKVWKDWCDRTTFHGFNELQYLTGRPYKAIFWSLAIVAATVATAYEIAVIFIGFYSSPTAIKVEKIQFTSQLLPDVVACSGAAVDAEKLRQDGASWLLVDGLLAALHGDPAELVTRYGGQEQEFLEDWEREWLVFAAANNVSDVVDLYSRYRIHCRDFVLGCTNFSTPTPWDCCEGAELILDPEYFGCYRLSRLGVQTWLGSRAGLSIVFKTSFPSTRGSLAGLKDGVALQTVPAEYPHDLFKVAVPGGVTAELSLEWEETRMLGVEANPCQSLLPNRPLALQENRTETACFLQKWNTEFIKECGCNCFGMPALEGVDFCQPFDFLRCFVLNQTTYKNIMTRSIAKQRECVPVCEKIDFQPVLSYMTLQRDTVRSLINKDPRYDNGSLSVVSIYYRSLSVSRNVEIYLYTVDTFISNVGGQIGLWMGCSILTVVQALTYLVKCFRIGLAKSEAWTRTATISAALHRRVSVSAPQEAQAEDQREARRDPLTPSPRPPLCFQPPTTACSTVFSVTL